MKKTTVTMGILLLYAASYSQDTHYETYQFGTQSALLGGAVVGGTRDNSMLVYNPAAIAFIDSSSFSINANLYQVENTHIQSQSTKQLDFKSLQLISVPLLTSGQFKTNIPKLRVSYGLFSPVAFQFRGQARIEGTYPVVPDNESAGDETFVGDELLFSRLRELNVAVGLSFKLNERLAVGLTNLFDVRSHYYNRAMFTYYYLNDAAQTQVSTSFTQSFNYFNLRYMPKVGIAYRGSRWSWGATATAPGLRLLGTGAVGVDMVANNVKLDPSTRGDVVVNGRRTKLKSYFKSPFSVATGIQFQVDETRLFLSGSYFSKQPVYAVLRATELPFVRPATATNLVNSNELLQVRTAAQPVLNFAFGIERPLNTHLTFNAGFRTNHSYYDASLLNENGIKPDISTWDLYHLVSGVTIRKERSSMSLGLAYAFGQDKTRSDQYLPLPAETNIFKSPIVNTQATYNSLGLVVGYNYFFRKG